MKSEVEFTRLRSTMPCAALLLLCSFASGQAISSSTDSKFRRLAANAYIPTPSEAGMSAAPASHEKDRRKGTTCEAYLFERDPGLEKSENIAVGG